MNYAAEASNHSQNPDNETPHNQPMPVSSASPQKTLFVVGAGASNEVGLPVGSNLKQSIADALRIKNREINDVIIGRAIYDVSKGAPALYEQACRHICDAMPQAISIDNFIDQHSGDKQIELCGKLAIVRTILAAEKNSKLFVDPSNSYNTMQFGLLENTWFTSLWKRLTENCSRSGLEERFKSVAFVIFNYDRCIEHYLYCSLKNIYRMGDQDAAQLVRSIEIYHPYGTVGSLPWYGGSDHSIGYGDEPRGNQLIKLIEQIKTFTEGTDEKSSDILAIREHMRTSPRIVFLGFAFHNLNLKLLHPSRLEGHTERHIYGTAFEMSTSSMVSICTELQNMGFIFPPILENKLKCFAFFHEFERNLSFV